MSSRLFSTDEELGKKDDDHKPGSARPWARHIPVHYRRRRTIIVLAAVLLLFLLRALASPSTDDDAPVARGGSPWGSSFRPTRAIPPDGPPPRDPDIDDVDQANHFYGGKIKFFDLAESLHKITSTNGLREKNRNALFAASNLQSVSALLPMACEMAKWNRNFVHFAVMGRNDVPLGDILEVNGIDKDGCAVIWHDARPDYVLFSSDRRAEAAVKAAMGHIHNFMHPQVVITDDPKREDLSFVKGMAQKTREHNIPIIEIPRNGADTLEWLTRLDTGSLKSWHRPTVDILIHAPPKSSGSLVRLVKSITAADYAGLVPPRILIDLPADVDPPTLRFLERVAWPPNPMPSALRPHVNQIILKHRIPRKRLSEEEVSIRFLESFYPTDPVDAHVMLINANTELSPLYYQYLMFHLLEYKYSPYAGHDKGHFFGISLEVPQFHLNGTTAFEQPLVSSMRNEKYQVQGYMDEPTPFTWVAPNANAALYFGDKWSEIHSFLANRLVAFELQKDPTPRPRTIHESQPSWMEYFLELMRARNYFLHYPGIDPVTHALVTVHNELYQPPEDSLSSPNSHDDDDDAADEDPPKTKRKSSNASPFLTGDTDAHKPPQHDELSLASRGSLLHQVLPFDGDPPELDALPLLLHNGTDVLIKDARTVAEEVTRKFREAIGGCGPPPEGKRRKVEGGSARDLFCFGDEGEEVWEREKGLAKSEKEAIEAEELGDDRKKGGGTPKSQEKKPPEKGRKSYMGEVLPPPDEKKTHKKDKGEDKSKDEEKNGSAKKTAGPHTEKESKEREEKEEESESKEKDSKKDDESKKGDDRKDDRKDGKKDDMKDGDDSSAFGGRHGQHELGRGRKEKGHQGQVGQRRHERRCKSTSDRGRDKERPRDKDI
ncbi:uncharacterized protein IWZ02DRAFT_445697 [Phyllosticta citriasiana]|uniref:uncharacterized protein n=1 Tax=Phyllosticta citriasiana TaxID=595635 RepID=UPI0030FD4841